MIGIEEAPGQAGSEVTPLRESETPPIYPQLSWVSRCTDGERRNEHIPNIPKPDTSSQCLSLQSAKWGDLTEDTWGPLKGKE